MPSFLSALLVSPALPWLGLAFGIVVFLIATRSWAGLFRAPQQTSPMSAEMQGALAIYLAIISQMGSGPDANADGQK